MKKLSFKLEPETGTLSEKDTKKYFSTIGFAIAAYMVAMYASTIIAALLFGRFAPSLLDNVIISSLISAVCQYGIAFPVCLLILFRLPKDTNPSEGIGFGKTVGGMCVALTLMSFGNSIGLFIIQLLEMATGKTLVNPVESATVGNSWIINLIFVAVLAPVMEELLFRKLFCDRLLPLGEGYAVVISAFIFGLAHGNFYQFFYAFLIGCFFSYLYVKTGRLRYSLGYHVIINLLGGVFAPWIIEKLSPIITEETVNRMLEIAESGNTEAFDAFISELTPYMPYFIAYTAYELIFTVGSIAGIVILMRMPKKMDLRRGLLPPPKEGRIANIFCNVGIAAAITVFVGIFLLGLL